MSRGTRDPNPGRENTFAYGAFTLFDRPFQIFQLVLSFLTSRRIRTFAQSGPTTPGMQRVRAITHTWFGLFPVRSPLLRESQLFSLPRGTEMFQFPRLPFHPYGFKMECFGIKPKPVFRFGNLRINTCKRFPGAYRSLPRPSSSTSAKASTVRTS